jgi:hypothetical protein
MLSDSSIRKSLDDYVKRRIKEIPIEIKQTFLKTKQIWRKLTLTSLNQKIILKKAGFDLITHAQDQEDVQGI